MEIFINLWNNWSNNEKISLLSLFLLLFILISFSVKFLTKNNSLFYFTILSLISSALFTLLGIFLLNVIFDITITHIFLLTPFIVLFINILNIGTCLGYYKLHNKKNKSFDYNQLKKEYIKDSVQLSIFILLLFSSFSVFLASPFLLFIILTAILCLGVIWFNYSLLYWLVK